MADLYADLEIAREADASTIKAAWRRAAKRFHPDVGASASKEYFARAQHAYMVLKDPVRRNEYNRTGVDPGETVDNEQAQILSAIQSLLAKYVLEGKTAIYKDLIGAMLNDLAEQEAKELVQQAQHAQSRQMIQDLQIRFQRQKKSDLPDLIDLALKGQLSMLDHADEMMGKSADFRKKVREVLCEYEFRFDRQAPQWGWLGQQASGLAGTGLFS